MTRTPVKTLIRAFALLVCLVGAEAKAHFLWLVPDSSEKGSVVQLVFSEDASPDDPEFLKHVAKAKVWQIGQGQKPLLLETERTEEALFARLPQGQLQDRLVIATHDLGVMNRDD